MAYYGHRVIAAKFLLFFWTIMDKEEALIAYLRGCPACPSPQGLRFLAAGEYNENYVVDCADGPLVARLNHGSQLGLANQIEYEFKVLQAVAPSGVTPKPLWVDSKPQGLDNGLMLMEYLPGGPLDYASGLDKAAHIFARIHALAPASGLIVQTDPVADLAEESLGLIQRYTDHPLPQVGKRLLDYHERVLKLRDETWPLFESEPNVMVNTEVNSGNFIIGKRGDYLVDWEKAVTSTRHQDLGHFVVITTTRWKTDVTLTAQEKRRFLAAYARELSQAGGPELKLDELEQKCRVLERTILLRALAWCYMAYYEYTQTERALQNQDTFAKIKTYLDESECILN
jgi:aminoglycoside phosphotransferase (APT) family kinase protein